jgi:uncharacterized membrane protein
MKDYECHHAVSVEEQASSRVAKAAAFITMIRDRRGIRVCGSIIGAIGAMIGTSAE